MGSGSSNVKLYYLLIQKMARAQERPKILHTPTTTEIFLCLCSMPTFSKILLERYPDEIYADFLRWLVNKNFFNEREERILIKKLASDYGADTAKVTKWIKKIYDQIFDLNFNHPELFQTNGIKVYMYIRNYDDHCSFYVSLPGLPREFESVSFPFVKSKVGSDFFWVKKIEHELSEDNFTVSIWLIGGFVNRYREFALEKAIFHERIHFLDVFRKRDSELDEELKRIYRH